MPRYRTILVAALACCAGAGPAAAQDSPPLYDDRLVQVADRVPEFGGMFIDEGARTLFVHVTERRPAIVADLRHALRDVFPGEDLPARITLLDADFTFHQLKRWKDRARDLLDIDGVDMTDIDDRSNRLTLGVTRSGLDDEIEQELAERDIPPSGWTVERLEQPSGEDLTLRERFRPLLGGLQIQIGGGLCTYGVSAIRQGVIGFITNSHCTPTRGVVDGTVAAQPSYAADTSNDIGVEHADPRYFTCAIGVKCRYSDSAFFRRTSGVLFSVVRNSTGSLSWDGSSRNPVAGEGEAFPGRGVHMVGRTSGHTIGQIDDSCADVDSSGGEFRYLCQATATYTRAGGDSGAPVFTLFACTINGTSSTCARIIGIHRGPSDVGAAFSPIYNVQRSDELGALDVCGEGLVC